MATYNGHNEDASGNILLSIGNGMTATLETGTTASQAYTKGAYLYYNNRLCKVTSAIASGNTLTIGTNIAYTTLGEELTSHLKATNGDEFYFDYKNGEPGYYPSASKTASQFVPIGGTTEAHGIFAAGSGTQTVKLGFRPATLMLVDNSMNNSNHLAVMYHESYSTTKWLGICYGNNNGVKTANLGSSAAVGWGCYPNITDTGFTFTRGNNSTKGTWYWCAAK